LTSEKFKCSGILYKISSNKVKELTQKIALSKKRIELNFKKETITITNMD
jgi:hypothetical protein